MANWYDKPLAVIGSGHACTATVINTLIDVWNRTPADTDRVELLVVDTRRRLPDPESLYPMNGIAPDDLHPFESERPPAGIQTFGDLLRGGAYTPVGTLEVPTYKDISYYLQVLLFSAKTVTSDKVAMTRIEKPMNRIEMSAAGFATILFSDDTMQMATPIIAKLPPHLGGVVQER